MTKINKINDNKIIYDGTKWNTTNKTIQNQNLVKSNKVKLRWEKYSEVKWSFCLIKEEITGREMQKGKKLVEQKRTRRTTTRR